MRVGFHTSIYGSVDKAVDRALTIGCNTLQMFTRNPRGWTARQLRDDEVEAFIIKVERNDVRPVFGHTPYLLNLASPKDEIYMKSIETLINEMNRCKRLKIPYLVTHLGSHLGYGVRIGLERVIKAIDKAFSVAGESVMLLLENTAGTRNSVGGSFNDLQYIIERATYQDKIGICFDTCHAFAAGYDLRTEENMEKVTRELGKTVGFTRLKLVHLNDSRGDLNSHIDRHEHIGLGKIGEKGFRNILRSKFASLPLILETPKDSVRSDLENLVKVKELAGVKSPLDIL
ncbi:MAG: deoxyribonuclease IV [Candidatus Bathyarchaeia archaeon]|nr:deoxyribonuclease IV [Candidatus Bathyarchaeota archaeon]